MDLTLSSTQADPRHDGGDVAAAAPADRLTAVEEALSRLAHQAARDTPQAQTPTEAADWSAGPRIAAPAPEPSRRIADWRIDLPASDRRPPRGGANAGRIGLVVAVCIAVPGTLVWRSHDGAARATIANWVSQLGWPSANQAPPSEPTAEAAAAQTAATLAVTPATEPPAPPAVPAQPAESAQAAEAARTAQAAPAAPTETATVAPSEPAAPSPAPPQINTLARDLAALRQSVEQLVAGQQQMAREIARLQAAEEQRQRRLSASPPPPAVTAARRALMPPPPPPPRQAAPQVSTAAPVPPSPQPALPPRPAPQAASPSPEPPDPPPPFRPPMPVPQP